MAVAPKSLSRLNRAEPPQQSANLNLQPVLSFLGPDRAEEVSLLEQRCYPAPWSQGLVISEFSKDISVRLGLVLDDVVVAYSFSYLIIDDLHLLNIAVAPEFRGKGFGRYLLANLLLHGLNSGASTVALEVRPSNIRALTLYRMMGFSQVGLRINYYRDNGEDALLLERALSEQDRGFIEQMVQTAL